MKPGHQLFYVFLFCKVYVYVSVCGSFAMFAIFAIVFKICWIESSFLASKVAFSFCVQENHGTGHFSGALVQLDVVVLFVRGYPFLVETAVAKYAVCFGITILNETEHVHLSS